MRRRRRRLRRQSEYWLAIIGLEDGGVRCHGNCYTVALGD